MFFLIALFPNWIWNYAGVGQQWPIPDDEFGLFIDEKGKIDASFK